MPASLKTLIAFEKGKIKQENHSGSAYGLQKMQGHFCRPSSPLSHNILNLNIKYFTVMVFINSWERNNISGTKGWEMKFRHGLVILCKIPYSLPAQPCSTDVIFNWFLKNCHQTSSSVTIRNVNKSTIIRWPCWRAGDEQHHWSVTHNDWLQSSLYSTSGGCEALPQLCCCGFVTIRI